MNSDAHNEQTQGASNGGPSWTLFGFAFCPFETGPNFGTLKCRKPDR
jgi:hypothetical protein